MSFEQLLRNAKQGDAAALEQLLELYRPLLMKNRCVWAVFARLLPNACRTLFDRRSLL